MFNQRIDDRRRHHLLGYGRLGADVVLVHVDLEVGCLLEQERDVRRTSGVVLPEDEIEAERACAPRDANCVEALQLPRCDDDIPARAQHEVARRGLVCDVAPGAADALEAEEVCHLARGELHALSSLLCVVIRVRERAFAFRGEGDRRFESGRDDFNPKFGW